MRPAESFLSQPIRSLQTMLRVIAEQDTTLPSLIPDGFYGTNTVRSVSAFQRRSGLPVTGITDQMTWDTVVAAYQLALTELGYLNGAADGNFGTGTQTAVKKFQQDQGLDADGIAGKLTLEALYQKSSVTPMPNSTPAVQPGDILDLPG